MTQRRTVGTLHGVAIEVAAWDGSAAEVDLSTAGMFSSEQGGGPPVGGLAHLDRALNGQLLRLRAEGVFAAQAGETLYLNRPPPPVTARALLILGMGSPIGWGAAQLASAVRGAVSTALALGVGTGAFAPSMLDSGLGPEQTDGAPAGMVQGIAAALAAHARMATVGWVRPAALTQWTFDVGAARFEGAAAAFGAVIAEHHA